MIFKPDLAISIFLTVHVKLSNHGTEIWGNDIVIRIRKKMQCVNKHKSLGLISHFQGTVLTVVIMYILI